MATRRESVARCVAGSESRIVAKVIHHPGFTYYINNKYPAPPSPLADHQGPRADSILSGAGLESPPPLTLIAKPPRFDYDGVAESRHVALK